VTERRFDAEYEAYAGRIYRYCLFFVNSRQEAEDITSEVFIRFLFHRRQIGSAPVLPWLFKVARNLCLNFLRRESRRRLVDKILLRDIARGSQRGDEPWHDPEVLRAVRRLRRRDQQVVFLRVFEDLSFLDVAGVLGMTEGAAKMAFSRSMRTLQAMLTDEEVSRCRLGGADLKGEHCGT
jgi:RNA polymerase sigma-70 factor, ECF subfamily